MTEFEISPPDYPLGREAFKRALSTGHGRALVHAREFDLSNFRDDILDAATDCKVYDRQIDGQREWWLARLCEHAGLVEAVIELSPGDSSRNRDLRACLLKEFCLVGHEAALPKLYAMCRRHADSNDVEAISELIEVEGDKGLIFAARALGEQLLSDPDFWVDDHEVWRYDDMYGTGRAKEILVAAASTDPAIRHFLQELAVYQDNARERSDPVTNPAYFESVASVIQTILSATKRVGLLRRWGNHASSEDRAEVAKLLKSESQVTVLSNVLWCLKGKGLPSYDETLLKLVFHEDDEVRFYAAKMFSHHVNPQVRAAGFALLERGDSAIATGLLRLNVTEDDTEQILSALARKSDEEDNHSTIGNLVAMLEDSGSAWGPMVPLHVYEFSLCMHCRERAVEYLIKNGICPQWLLDEATFDGSEDIRKLVTDQKA